METVERKEKSAARRIAALIGSFAAGVLLTWVVGVAGSNTAKSEERLALSARPSAIEQTVNAAADDSSVAQPVRGHSECDLQLD